MRGRFTPGANEEEWCERRLLARIHHYTVKRLRAEIEPVAARDFLRFLFAWQQVEAETRIEGPDALRGRPRAARRLRSAGRAWETEILPARLDGYEPAWLDDQCLAGRCRLGAAARRAPGRARERAAAPVRTTPIALLARRHARSGRSLAAAAAMQAGRPRARAVLDCIARAGRLVLRRAGRRRAACCAPRSRRRSAELVALGLVTSDSFGGLRALLVPADRARPLGAGARRRRVPGFGMEAAGRWALARRPPPGAAEPRPRASRHRARGAHAAARYGVVFWRLLAREADWLPPWRDLLRVFRRLEARGEIRGGRFVA